MAQITDVVEPTTWTLRHAIEAMASYLDPCLTVAEIREQVTHCTRAELISMATELETRVVARGQAWQAEHRGAA